MTVALLDTSVLIAIESGRRLYSVALEFDVRVSVITLGELHAGVLAATSVDERASRMATLEFVSALDPLVVNDAVAREWARLRVRLIEAGRSMGVNDLWIAAIASANRLPLVTQDRGFEVLDGLGATEVVFV